MNEALKKFDTAVDKVVLQYMDDNKEPTIKDLLSHWVKLTAAITLSAAELDTEEDLDNLAEMVSNAVKNAIIHLAKNNSGVGVKIQ